MNRLLARSFALLLFISPAGVTCMPPVVSGAEPHVMSCCVGRAERCAPMVPSLRCCGPERPQPMPASAPAVGACSVRADSLLFATVSIDHADAAVVAARVARERSRMALPHDRPHLLHSVFLI